MQSKVYFLFSKFDTISLKNQQDFLNQLKENNKNINIISLTNKIRYIEKLKILNGELSFIVRSFGNYLNNGIFTKNTNVALRCYSYALKALEQDA